MTLDTIVHIEFDPKTTVEQIIDLKQQMQKVLQGIVFGTGLTKSVSINYELNWK